MADRPYGTEPVTYKGREYVIEYYTDDDTDTPWDRECGHGHVSEWTTNPKAPHERVLCKRGRSFRYYDMHETMRTARSQGWGLHATEIEKLAIEHNRKPTKAMIVAEAVERDFKRLKDWCDNAWFYAGVIVRDVLTDATAMCFGYESDYIDTPPRSSTTTSMT